jgi:hypothetical protein
LKGLFLVAHQKGGDIFAFWLPSRADKTIAKLYGRYKTAGNESAGLEYDIKNKELYIWHGGGENTLEVSKLERLEVSKLEGNVNNIDPIEDGMLKVHDLYLSKNREANWEGIAIDSNKNVLFLTEDGKDRPDNLQRIDLK